MTKGLFRITEADSRRIFNSAATFAIRSKLTSDHETGSSKIHYHQFCFQSLHEYAFRLLNFKYYSRQLNKFKLGI